MEAPFVFGRIATGENFTDRIEETSHLVNNFTSLINTIIISPRRWGKSSLVHKAVDEATSKDTRLRVCEVDLFNVRTEQDFYQMLAESVIKATSNKWDDVKSATMQFMSKILPKIVMTAEPGLEFTLDLDWDRTKNNIDEILDLAEKIAQERNLKIMICIDEFQNISYFSDPVFIQKRLRAHWQKHQRVGYCLYGSKRHMMLEVFTDSSRPFYKFGDLIFLNKIKADYFHEFICKRFTETGKSIDVEAAYKITELVDCHPYYVQQLAQLSWLRTQDICNLEIVNEAHTSLVEQLSLLFSTLTQPLTNQQVAYLKAIVDDCDSISSTKSMSKYSISSSTSAMRSKTALIKLDILDDIAGKIQLQDPIYKHWLKHVYFA